MSRQASPTLIGVFVFGAIALGVITILLLSEGRWFHKYRQYVLYFEAGAQGLQVGAPVDFLGVKVGTVKQIQLGLAGDDLKFLVPVTIEIEASVEQAPGVEQLDLNDPESMRRLIERGLRAQLRMQSLLTGQLQVSLDFFPDKPARFFARTPDVSEIPTISTTMEDLSQKLQQFPMDKFLNDIAAISASLNKLLAAGELSELPQQVNRTLKHLESLARKLDEQSTPVLLELRTDLRALDEALNAVKLAADRFVLLSDPDGVLLSKLTRASEDLAGAARAVRDLSREDAPVVVHFDDMLQEVARAARSLRALAETLEQQPEAILWGKRSPPVEHDE